MMAVRHICVLFAAVLGMISSGAPAYAQPAPDVAEFSLPASVAPGKDLTFTVTATNTGQSVATSGSISISFPENPRVTVAESSPARSSGSHATVFAPNASIYNFTERANMLAKYTLAELYLQENWAPGQSRFITLKVTAPTSRSTLTVQTRVTLRSSAGAFYNYPATGVLDQQGFPVDLRLVPVQAPPPPPTPTTAPPRPTRTPVPATATAAPTQTPFVIIATAAPAANKSPGIDVAGATAVSSAAPPFASLPTSTSAPSPSDSSAMLLLIGVLVAAGAIAAAAIAFTRRPAPRQATYASVPPQPRASYPQPSPPPPGGSFPPVGGGPMSGPIPTGYQIVGTPKHGGMATVYKALQPALHRYVALKVLSPSLGSDPSFVQRFQNEARATARLDHPNIVPVYDMGQANGSVFIVMRYIEGGTLQELLERESRLPVNRAIGITAQVASALDYAHSQGFVHRDVKPANIMVEAGDRATLTDFGIAKAVGETRLTRTGSIVGTPEYLSPEQAKGDPVDGRADLYALGIVVYEMLAGRTPFQTENPLSVVHHHIMTPPPPPTQFNPSIPTGIVAAILKVLAKDPSQRYPTAEAFVQALRQGAGGRV